MDARSHEVIAPAGQDVPLAGGRIVTVMPITVGQLPRFVKAIRPAFGALVALSSEPSSPEASGDPGADSLPHIGEVGAAAAEAQADGSQAPAADGMDPVAVLDLYAEHGESLNQAVCICTGLELSEVEAMNLEEAFSLLRAVWEVNRDFFVQRVKPLLLR